MKKQFKSSDYVFRPTTLSEAMRKVGLIETPHLVREAKQEGLLRARQDIYNSQPSVRIAPLAA